MQFSDARKYKKQIRNLYKSAFPANERAPLFLLFRRTDNGRDSFYAVLDNNKFIGLTYTISTKTVVYVFFLAVTEENRGAGYGSKILDSIKKMHSDKTVILLIEDTDNQNADNLDERIRRLEFYKRNGFKQLHIKINEAGVDYELMGTDTTVTLSDFLALMKDYLGAFLFKIIYRKTDLSQSKRMVD